MGGLRVRKVITFLVAFLFLTLPMKVYAADTTVEVKVEGEVKKGNNINITLNLSDVENFYAGSVDFIYDTELLKVNSIASTDFITGNSDEIMEIGGETAKNGNTATYGFTFVGDKPGISGSGALVTINATVMSDEELSINKGNMKVKLVQKTDDTVVSYGYNFIGVGNQEVAEENTTTEGTNNTTDGGTAETTNNNTENTVTTDEVAEETIAEVEEESNKKSFSDMIANAFKDFNPFSSETSFPKRIIAYLVIIGAAVGLVVLGNYVYKKIQENK